MAIPELSRPIRQAGGQHAFVTKPWHPSTCYASPSAFCRPAPECPCACETSCRHRTAKRTLRRELTMRLVSSYGRVPSSERSVHIEGRAPMEVSCAFPTALDSPDNIALAEQLGYHRAWIYDTPQQSPDVWMTLALAAQRTERIGLGPGVLVPSLRHPMVNAAATATLCALAPGRVAVSFGTGFTGRRAMGYPALPWAFMGSYIRTYRALLRGEVVEWEGARMQMLHPDGHAPARPVEVPVLIAALGPKGNKAAHELGDGLFATLAMPEFMSDYAWTAYLAWCTVLDEGEPDDSERARVAGGPGWALSLHGAYEFGGPD